MLTVGVLVLLFLGVYALYMTKNHEITTSRQFLEERVNCWELSTTITNIFLLGDTADTTVTLRYDFTVEPREKRLASEHAFCTFSIGSVAHNVSATVEAFKVSAGKVRVHNDRGLIVLGG